MRAIRSTHKLVSPPSLAGKGAGGLGLLCLLMLAFLAGCRPEPKPPPNVFLPTKPGAGNAQATTRPDTPKVMAAGGGVISKPFPRRVPDSRGKMLILNAPPQRILSLAPSHTELLYALGLGDRIVGVTSACDYPPEAKNKPYISGAGGQIDLEKVQAANPDLVIAIAAINGKAIETLEKANVPVLTADPKIVVGIYDTILLLGRATGTDSQAGKVVQEMQRRIEAVRAKTLRIKNRPKILIAYGDNPIYTTGPGSFIDDILKVAGGQNIVDEPLPGNVISSEQALLRQPEVILCSPETRDKLKQMPGWATGVPAVRNNRFFTFTNAGALVRPGPRLAPSAEELARYLHPELFDEKAEGAKPLAKSSR